MSQRFFEIGSVGNGRLIIGPRPQAGTLDDWVNAAKGTGINHVVSLIEEAEVERYGLDREGERLAANGIGFTRFPVDDFDIPDDGAFRKLIDDLTTKLGSGQTLFLHCAGGVGRAGTTASCLLVEHGWEPDDAMKLVSKKRGMRSPETAAQEDFVRRWRT